MLMITIRIKKFGTNEFSPSVDQVNPPGAICLRNFEQNNFLH